MTFKRSPARALIPTVGIVLGVAITSLSINLGNSSWAYAKEQHQKLHPNVWLIRLQAPTNSGFKRLKLEDFQKLPQLLSNVELTSEIIFENSQVFNLADNQSYNIVNASPSFNRIVALDVSFGRMLTDLDLNTGAIVIGSTIAKKINYPHDSSIQTLNIGSKFYRIVGIAKNINYPQVLPFDISSSIFTYQSISHFKNPMGFDMALVKTSANSTNETSEYAKKIIRSLGYTPDPAIIRPTQLTELISSQARLIAKFLMFGAISTIVLGAINIASTLLLTTRERSREIGIRLAVGGKPSDVTMLFLFEIFFATFTGSIFGTFLGFTISLSVELFIGLPISISFSAALISIVSTICTGLAFGIYPAVKASRLNPINAINFVN
ncbi:ABC transporter permease [Acidovorax sp. DW039]|uniref:ABC transporter permease n=1 Tax=Acidovorax sp. DW039 TaxID=3095606 RepID=UPI00308D3139|nr:ABC transporter permease [Acidovorax sp. DW039]